MTSRSWREQSIDEHNVTNSGISHWLSAILTVHIYKLLAPYMPSFNSEFYLRYVLHKCPKNINGNIERKWENLTAILQNVLRSFGIANEDMILCILLLWDFIIFHKLQTSHI